VAPTTIDATMMRLGPDPSGISRARLAYGDNTSQFATLSLPDDADAEPVPVVVLIHGGFWRAQFAQDLMIPLAEDLRERGFAVWNLEYRRVGQDGGGYPGTLDDVAAGIDHLASLADAQGLDLDRVGVVGHSAGGQLAQWAGSRSLLAPGDPGAEPTVQPVLTIGQAPVTRMGRGADTGLGSNAVTDFMGGTPSEIPDSYRVAAPSQTEGVEMISIVGTADDIVPSEFSNGTDSGDPVEVVTIEGADHFAMIDPTHEAWAAVVDRLADL